MESNSVQPQREQIRIDSYIDCHNCKRRVIHSVIKRNTDNLNQKQRIYQDLVLLFNKPGEVQKLK